MKFAFTQRRLDTLAVPDEGRAVYHDTKISGLCVRVTATGAKSAYLSKKVGGRHDRFRLGKWPEDFGTVKTLRDAAQAALGNLDALAVQRRAARLEPTLADLWASWWEHATEHKKPKSRSEDDRQYTTFLAKWAKRPLSQITRKDVATLHQRTGRDHGHYAANRLLSLLSAMWNEGRRAGLCEGESPAKDIRRFKETKRDRWLDGDELRRLLTVLAECEPDIRDFFLLCLLTGARRSNVQAMRWADVDLRLGLWKIPETKSGDPVVVPLVRPAVVILEARREQANGCPWVFPGRGKRGHLMEPKRAWAAIRQRAGIPDVRIHDLRRTLGSWMAVAGTSLQVIGKSLGHRDLKSTEVYARLSVDPVREAVEKATAAMLEMDIAKP
ncbi:MAG TPA: tyrosine-type recombinase/integrase [Thermoguttaceae bacterium]|nr:tyrosine-type recombinase/integrase [Thermoguttaceae bacterium]